MPSTFLSRLAGSLQLNTFSLKKIPAKCRPDQRYVHWMLESPANDNYDLTPADTNVSCYGALTCQIYVCRNGFVITFLTGLGYNNLSSPTTHTRPRTRHPLVIVVMYMYHLPPHESKHQPILVNQVQTMKKGRTIVL